MTGLDADVLRLATSSVLATVVTLMPDGCPQALPTWIDSDGEVLLVNTEPARQRTRNVARDPRVTVLMVSATDPFDWAEVRGHVVGTVTGSGARDHLDELAQRYVGDRFRMPLGPDGRVILRIAADHVNTPHRMGIDPARRNAEPRADHVRD